MSVSDTIIEQRPLSDFTEKAYLDYSMYVILDRALPHIGDGLKPVQRRIVYAMSELGLKSTAKHKKSARTVGDVLGKFHPHGDSACYEAMVLMAQPFSYRYPFIDGQGNWGSPDDPKSFAAMRYTESRLTAYAQTLLKEAGQGTIDWVPNFDGTLEEPKLLPARVPNLLLNGTTGIAVGMATDIPPHNLNEVMDACIHLLDHPKATLEEVMQHIQAPDFPTEAEIINAPEEIQEMYSTGHGSIRMRAAVTVDKTDIIIHALPHQVSGTKILEQIAAQMLAKKLPTVADIRDESDHENPTRLVIEARSNRVDMDQLLSHLFATTDLERTYRVNMNMIGINGKPQVKPLVPLLREWLSYRKDTVTRRLQHRLDQVEARLHILDGLLIAFLNLDEVIQIIREADNPKAELIKRFKLSEIQADAILDIKLRQLAKLEEIKIKAEQKELADEKKEIEALLKSDARLKTFIKKEMQADRDEYGDARRSPIVARTEAKAMKEEELVTAEPITVILSKLGWVRAAKGHEIVGENLNYKAGDGFLIQAQGKSNEQVSFIDSTGRAYSLAAHTLPSARGQGDPLTKRFKPQPGVGYVGALMGQADQKYLFASDAGYGFISTFENTLCKNKVGKAFLKCPKDSQALTPCLIEDIESEFIAALSTAGHLLVFPLACLPELPRGKGNKIIGIPSAKLAIREEYCRGVVLVKETQSLKLLSGKRHLTLSPKDLAHFHGERGRRGALLPRGFRNVDVMLVE